MGKILGLDLETNSIGWAIVDSDTNKFLYYGTRKVPAVISREDRRSKSRTLLRTNYRSENFVKLLQKVKHSPILTSLAVLTALTFIFAVTNNANWQFWLNICLTTLLTTLTLIYQNKEK